MKKYFKRIAFYFGRRHLKRNLLNRRVQRETVTFAEAKHIGLLFTAHSEEDIATAHAYISELKQKGKEVDYIGLILIKDYRKKNKENINPHYIFESDFDIFHRPGKSMIEQFYKKDFDLLLSLNYTHAFSINYIASLSKAKLRVGKYSPNITIAYDFMINEPRTDLKSYIDTLQHYLGELKKHK